MNKKLVSFLIIFFVAHSTFAQTANWSAVMTKGTYKQAYNDFATTDEVTESLLMDRQKQILNRRGCSSGILSADRLA